jgi:hypothetical protein
MCGPFLTTKPALWLEHGHRTNFFTMCGPFLFGLELAGNLCDLSGPDEPLPIPYHLPRSRQAAGARLLRARPTPESGHRTEPTTRSPTRPKFDRLEKAKEDNAAAQIADMHGFYEAQDGKEEEMRDLDEAAGMFVTTGGGASQSRSRNPSPSSPPCPVPGTGSPRTRTMYRAALA